MNIKFIVFSNSQTGQGHYFRCEALAKLALEYGNSISLIGDRKFPFLPENSFTSSEYKEEFATSGAFDWVIADLPFSPILHTRAKTCLLNGVGYELETNYDLVIIQGFSNVKGENIFSGSRFVILRSDLLKYKRSATDKTASWFVWGGSEDDMNLLSKFSFVYSTFHRIESELELWLQHSTDKYGKLFQKTNSPELLLFNMGASKKACVAMGMIVWELIYLGVPTYVFSSTKKHLSFAKPLHDLGLIRAWYKVGVPKPREIKEFIETPFRVSNNDRPDLLGANRILSLLEERL